MHIGFAPPFLRNFKRLTPELQQQAHAAIDALKDRGNHQQLKVHKLKGRYGGLYAFSINYRYRIIFEYLTPDAIWLLNIGDHDIYQ